jgi:hypothetical protein
VNNGRELSAVMRVSPVACGSIAAPPSYRVMQEAKNNAFSHNIDFPGL